MSCPIAKKERSAAKDIRQGVVPQREHPQRKLKKTAKPYKVWYKWPFKWFTKEKEEYVRKRFATRQEAEAYIDKECRRWHRPNDDQRQYYRIEGPEDAPIRTP